MDAFFQHVARALGGKVAPDHLKIATSILGAYPCSLLLRRIRSPTVKHLFSIAFTTLVMVGILQFYFGFSHLILTGCASYELMKHYTGQKGPWINLFLVMSSMAYCHIDRQIKGVEGDTELDYSGAMMVAAIKLSSFGFNVRDGRQARLGDKGYKLTTYNERMKIDDFPTLTEFFGWVCFFGGFLAGPACEYMDYFRFIHLRLEDTGIQKPPKGAPPLSTWKPTLIVLSKVALGFSLLLTVLAPYSYFAALEPAWLALPFHKRLFFLAICGFTTRVKYYTIWFLSEGACVLAGIGFNGYDDQGRPRWDRMTNVDVVGLEKSQSFTRFTITWNKGANNWLRHYVYTRVLPPTQKPGFRSLLATYTTSSVWHGFHPGYFFFFFTSSAYQVLGRYFRRYVRPLALSANGKHPLPFWKSLYDILGWIISHAILGTVVMTFDLLYFSRIMHIHRGVYYITYWIPVLGALFLVSAIPALKAMQARRVADASNEILAKEPSMTPALPPNLQKDMPTCKLEGATSQMTVDDLDVAKRPVVSA